MIRGWALSGGLWLVLGVYLLLSVSALVLWDAQGVYGLTGDEPHYLVIADALLRDGTPEVSASYAREFAEARFYAPGLAPIGASLEPPWAHVVNAPAGVFSWHGMGISAFVAVPLATVGIWGAKAAMLASGVLIILAVWKLALWAGLRKPFRLFAVASVALTYPVLLASGQIYPDLWAGALLLAFLAWLLIPSLRTPWVTAAVSFGVGALPWLGMKFAVPALIASLVLVTVAWRGRKNKAFASAALAPVAVLGIALAVSNVLLFGSLLGPPVSGTLAFGREFWMLLPGLLLDQNQGPLFYSPVLWLGLLGIGIFARRAHCAALVWALLFISLWLPAAAHPGLYGLGSFNGRYSWPLATLLIVPTLLALDWLLERSRRAFWAVIWVSLAFAAYFYAIAVLPIGLDLYTKPIDSWLPAYSFAWFPIQGILPAWYSTAWSFTFGPNWVWLALAITLVVFGFFRGIASFPHPRRWGIGVPILAVGVLVGAGILLPATSSPQVVNVERTAIAGAEPAGYVAQGPMWPMRLGTYEWFVEYRAPGNSVVGKWELIRTADDSVVAAGELVGTESQARESGAVIPFRSYAPKEFIMRIGWYAREDMSVSKLGVRYRGW